MTLTSSLLPQTAVVAVTAVAWTFRTKKPASIRDEAAAPEASIREDTAACSCGDTAECIAAKKQLEEVCKLKPRLLLSFLTAIENDRKGHSGTSLGATCSLLVAVRSKSKQDSI